MPIDLRNRGLTAYAGLAGEEQPPAPPAPPTVPTLDFSFLQDDPNYHDLTDPRAPTRDIKGVNEVILHDRGGTYRGTSPYHIEVLPDGRIMNHWRADQKAPHAYRANPTSIGVSYGDQVGAKLTPEAEVSMRKIISGLRERYPHLKFASHGEAYAATRGTDRQASRAGRGLEEASWRSVVLAPPTGGGSDNPPTAPPQSAGYSVAGLGGAGNASASLSPAPSVAAATQPPGGMPSPASGGGAGSSPSFSSVLAGLTTPSGSGGASPLGALGSTLGGLAGSQESGGGGGETRNVAADALQSTMAQAERTNAEYDRQHSEIIKRILARRKEAADGLVG